MSLPPTNATLDDCRAFAKAVQQARGRVPTTLAAILLSAEALLSATGAPSDPARTIVDAAVTSTLTAERLDELITEAAYARAKRWAM